MALTRTWLQMGLEWDSLSRWFRRHIWFLESICKVTSGREGGGGKFLELR